MRTLALCRRAFARGLFLGSCLLALMVRAQLTDPPSITLQPLSHTNDAGTYAAFTVALTGSEPLSYQWFKEAVPLVEGSHYLGTQTNQLYISSVMKADEGGYRVVITNSYGAATSTVATLTVLDPSLRQSPVNVSVPVGGMANFYASVAGTAPLTNQWRFNGAALPGKTSQSLLLPGVEAADAGLYDLVSGNAFGCVTSAPAMLTVNTVTLDALSADANNLVYAMAESSGGRVVVGGAFTGLGIYARNRLARLLPDGSVDTLYNPNANQDVNCLLQLPDGTLLVGGAFTTLGGKACRYLGRLHADGTLDTNFNAQATGTIYCLSWQADGGIVAGGAGTLLRVDPSGAIDPAFRPSVSGTIYSVAGLPDGRIFVGGGFSSVAGSLRQNLARLNAGGTIDAGFNVAVTGTVRVLLAQTDGGLLIGGALSKVGQESRLNLARINPDDTVSSSFNPGANGTVYSLAARADGRLILSGDFSRLANITRTYLGCLNPDGSVDPCFAPSASSSVRAVMFQANGQLLVGGSFSSIANGTRTRFARLNTGGDVTQELTSSGGKITWLRGDALPEVQDVVMEAFAPGSGWTFLAAGVRIPGGWQADGTMIPNVTLRARGKASGGCDSGSASIVEFVAGPVVITTQPVSQTVSSPTSVTFSVSAAGTGPMTYQWYRNGSAIAGATTAQYAIGLPGAQYQVVVCNSAGCAQSDTVMVWRINMADNSARPNPDSGVFALALQADGKVLIGGAFTNASGTNRNGLVRLNPDGTLDASFDPDVSGSVYCLAILPDGKILLGGSFSAVSGQARANLCRLNADGTVDGAYVANALGPADAAVYCLVPWLDGKVLVGGHFSSLAGQNRRDLGRLEANGTLDFSFVPPVNLHPSAEVNCIVPVPGRPPVSGGSLLVGGRFAVNPGAYMAYELLSENGGYTSGGYVMTSFQGAVRAAARVANGWVLLGGSAFQVDAQPARQLARLNANLLPDATFTGSANGPVFCLAAQADGRVLVGGAFSALNGVSRSCLGRLLADGSLDTAFAPNLTSVSGPSVSSLAVQDDGKVLAGGYFTNAAGASRNNFLRLHADRPATESWEDDGAGLTWLRGGSAPELDAVAAETSADGLNWAPLSNGVRVPGGWQLGVAEPPPAVQTRVRGTVPASGINAWPTETFLTPPAIATQPASRTNGFGTQAAFYVAAQGPGPFGYQWLRNGVPLADGATVAGTRAALLILNNVDASDAGAYSVVVTNLFGSVASDLATLTCIDLAVPPSILVDDPAFGLQGGLFTFRVLALVGQTCVVEVSSNLRTWTPVKTNAVTTPDPFTFIDPDTPVQPQRHYRVRLR